MTDRLPAFLILLVLCLFVQIAHADPYLALQAGRSWAHIPTTARIFSHFDLQEESSSARLALGTKHDWWAVELGYSPRLSQIEAHGVIKPDFDIHQRITTSAIDLRGLITVPVDSGLQLRLIGGLAWVHFDNHEYGYNTPDHAPVEWRNSGAGFTPLFGVGIGYQLTRNLGVTLDAVRLNNVARSRWTLQSEITTLAAGITWRLP